MKIAVIGAGYVGLVTGAGLASTGNKVTCVDIDEEKINLLADGQVPIHEPRLEQLVRDGLAKQNLSFSTDLGRAIRSSKIIFVTVGTPAQVDGRQDLSTVDTVCEQIAGAANGPKTLVMKSTVLPGTARKIGEKLQTSRHKIAYVSNPEFLKEGSAIDDFLKPDRVVIGSEDQDAIEEIETLYV